MNKKLVFYVLLLTLSSLRAATCPAAVDELKAKAAKLQDDVALLKKKGDGLKAKAEKLKADGEWIAKVQSGLGERIKGIQESAQTFQVVFKKYQDFVIAVKNFNSAQGSFNKFLGQVTNR